MEKKDAINIVREELRKYVKGYEILIEYWDCISDEEKPKVHERLKEIGL
jgi:hypothetical protein